MRSVVRGRRDVATAPLRPGARPEAGVTGNPLRQASPLRSRSAQAASGTVRVICGVHTLEAPVAGRSVEEVRAALAQALNISPAAVAVVDGVEVGAGHVLREGEQLEFVRLAGEKG